MTTTEGEAEEEEDVREEDEDELVEVVEGVEEEDVEVVDDVVVDEVSEAGSVVEDCEVELVVVELGLAVTVSVTIVAGKVVVLGTGEVVREPPTPPMTVVLSLVAELSAVVVEDDTFVADAADERSDEVEEFVGVAITEVFVGLAMTEVFVEVATTEEDVEFVGAAPMADVLELEVPPVESSQRIVTLGEALTKAMAPPP